MSRIYFHSPSGDAALAGAERHWFGRLVSKTFMAHVDFPRCTDKIESCWILKLLPPSSYAAKTLHEAWDGSSPYGFMQRGYEASVTYTLETYLNSAGMMGEYFTWKGEKIDPFHLKLNTAIAAGSKAVRLAARLHGQCEIHAWVAGKNRKWLADIIRKGVRDRVLREGMGYLKPLGYSDYSVIDLLELRDDEPVATSYSVCDSFPSYHHVEDRTLIPGYKPEPEDVDEGDNYKIVDDNVESFYSMPVKKQWELAMPALTPSLEIKPDDFDGYGFGDGRSVFDIRHDFYSEQEKE